MRETSEKHYELFTVRFSGTLAQIGHYSLLLHKNFEQVNAVEPNPDALRVLKLGIRLARLDNIKVYPMALSNSDGDMKFYTSRSKTRFLNVHYSPATLLEQFDYRGSNPSADFDYIGQEFIPVKAAKFDSLVN